MYKRPLTDKVTIDLTELDDSPSKEKTHTHKVWISNPFNILQELDCQLISSSTGWLNDKIIHASQQLLAQHFPHTEGLQSPTLEQINRFEAHSGDFVQIGNVRSSHWILVCNLGCERNTVNVYDTMYLSLPSSTVDTIARLVFCPSPKLVIRMVDVDLQTRGDCGVLSLAIAFDILSSKAPRVTKYDHKLIRQHLCDCLSKCCFSVFPARGERSLVNIQYKNTFEVDALANYQNTQENSGQSVKVVLAGFIATVWTFRTVFSARQTSPGTVLLAEKSEFYNL